MAITYRGERFSGYNKPKRTPGKNKKFAVLAKEGSNVKLVRFGDPKMRIKKSNPERRKSFRAKLTAGYWSCVPSATQMRREKIETHGWLLVVQKLVGEPHAR
jgi:hypothetical protein